MVRDWVTREFKDPESEKFRDERVFRTKVWPRNSKTGEEVESDGVYVCGEVNAKNSFDAYAGYRQYWSSGLVVILEGEDNEVYPSVMLHYCNRK